MYDETAKQALKPSGMVGLPNIPEQLASRKENLLKSLKEVESAIEIFEKYPEMAEALSLVRRIL